MKVELKVVVETSERETPERVTQVIQTFLENYTPWRGKVSWLRATHLEEFSDAEGLAERSGGCDRGPGG